MRVREKIGSAWKWLYPGLGVKRWLALLAAGLLLLSIGVSFFYVQVYRRLEFTGAASPVAYYLTLQSLPHWLRGLLLASVGVACVAFAVLRLSKSLISAVSDGNQGNIVDVIYRRRVRERGPKIVAIGGGTGLSTLLRGLKEHTDNLTAIVTVADDGGSSGRLRKELGLLPPGDFRNCIAALAEAESLMTQLFQYRFGAGDGLNGHSFGNLFIAAMTGIVGDFARAIRMSSEVLAVRGRVLPSTMQSVTLCAELAEDADGGAARHQVRGESRIPEAGVPIERVFLQPDDVKAYGEAVQALLGADLITVGPGSLYTSILPNLLVKGIAAALCASAAPKVYICNLATQVGETDGYDAVDHVRALSEHIGEDLFDYVLVNDNLDVQEPADWNAEMVIPMVDDAHCVCAADLVDAEKPWRHDPAKLAKTVMDIYARHQQH
ncbi:MAG TPA: gluconeogenesis factor YvcK family protein [Anaerolineae bacterium]|nr:gluconeogenesis factor YvcK family protein [Anaerolineae bacterium]